LNCSFKNRASRQEANLPKSLKRQGKNKGESVMKNTTLNGLWNVTFGEIGATLKALQDHGVKREHLARLRADSDYAKRVAEFMLRGGLDGSVYQRHARAIMGKNFFGAEESTPHKITNYHRYGLAASRKLPS